MLAMANAEFGVIGLGVMGRNFLLNVAGRGTSVVGYDVDAAKREQAAMGSGIECASDLAHFFKQLVTPRKIMLFVPENLVDDVIAECLPMFDPDDLLIDGGNSHFGDTERRSALVASKGVRYLGVGVSGGEEGARNGACIMAGGDSESYARVEAILRSASARVADEPCCAHVGNGSAGHFVKMTHNGIEYAMMQVIAEAYDVMSRILGMSAQESSKVFSEWNDGRLGSFLIEITADVLEKKDSETDSALVDVILDRAAQKGTGKWTSQAAMDLGVPIPSIDSAVSMRQISSFKELRGRVSKVVGGAVGIDASSRSDMLAELEATVYGSFISIYAQGMALLRAASVEKSYGLNLAEIAKIWRGGCIIRSRMLDDIRAAFESDPALESMFLDGFFSSQLREILPAWRSVLGTMTSKGIPALGISSALNYVVAMSSDRLPANLIQAQRDFFGAHTYERTDRSGKFHTSDWKSDD